MNRAEISKFLTGGIEKLKIAVVGDIMLDRYYYGEVKRISPEAPVPIARVLNENSCLGGAANVANNLVQLGVQVYMGGVVGADDNGVKLRAMMQNTGHGIDTTGMLVDDTRPTTTKLRVLGAQQQMLRLDFEDTHPLGINQQNQLLEWLTELLNQGLKGLIISDYGKGLCTESFCQTMITQAHRAGIAVLVDPKGSDWSKYRGVDYITPNLKELGEALGGAVANEDESVVAAAQQLRARYNIDNILVTRSERGATLVGEQKSYSDRATSREVFDVSGAGDTMAATFMSGIVGGLSQFDAVKMSNLAAGVVVGKVGTKPIVLPELLDAVRNVEREIGYEQRIVDSTQAAQLIRMWQANGKKVIFTNGCFDILHIGHVSYLADARKLGDKLVIGLNSDSSVRTLKGATRPLVDQHARAVLLANLSAVNLVVIFDEQTPERLLSELRPDVLVKGGDYQAEAVLGREFVQKVEILPFVDGYSTTDIVNKIAKLAKENKI